MSARQNPGARRAARRVAREAAQDRVARRCPHGVSPASCCLRCRRETSAPAVAATAVVEPDARAYDAGPFWVVAPDTPAADRWLRRHVSRESTWHRGELVVEPRFVVDLVEAMRAAGLQVTA